MWDWLTSVSATAWLTVAAIIVGPIAAVRIEKFLEVEREKNRRRMDLFRTLMLHRASPLSADNVAALNSIDLVFWGPKFQKVRTVWKTLLSHYNDAPRPELPHFQEAQVVWIDKVNDLSSQLLREMGTQLGFEFDDVEIQKGVYAPRAHFDQETANTIIRDGVVKILAGEQELGIRIVVDDEQTAESHRILRAVLDVLEGSRPLSVKLDESERDI